MDELEASEKKQPLSIGGWLILVGIGIVFSPIRLIFTLFTDFTPIFTGGAWAKLTTPDDPAYIPYFSVFFIAETFLNAAIAVVWIYIGYLFFSKKSSLPKWYFGLSIFSIIFIISDSYVGALLTSDSNIFDGDILKEIFRGLVSLCIWSPYLLYSQRAKDTFVN